MPYIKPEKRPHLNKIIERFPMLSKGELNYVMTKLALRFVAARQRNYDILSDVDGVFGTAQKEFYRRFIAPYEDQKIQENGDVF